MNDDAGILVQVAEAARRAGQATERRDQLIRTARTAGYSQHVIARAAGMSQPGVKKIIDRGGPSMPDMPYTVTDWLARNRVELDPDEQGTSVWAEWEPGDDGDGVLYLGWWASPTCPRCGQTDRPRHPLAVPNGFTDNNWQHGCGEWWRPEDVSVAVAADADEGQVHAALDEALAELRAEQTDQLGKVRRGLESDLREFLALPEDEREYRRSGSAIEPGVWRNDGGEWEAWDYDPSQVGETITVRESDLT